MAKAQYSRVPDKHTGRLLVFENKSHLYFFFFTDSKQIPPRYLELDITSIWKPRIDTKE